MSSGNVSTAVGHFMKSPLVSWAKTFQDEEKKVLEFRGLCDGVFLYNIWLEIDPHPPYHGINLSTDDVATRIRNLDVLVHNIKAFYEEVLGQLLVMKIPDIITLAKNQEEQLCVGEMETLLLLILGCAVQCERKEYFIEVIKSMDLEVQHKIVDYIQQITDNPETVWTSEWNELSLIPQDDHEHMYNLLVQHLRHLVRDRDELAQRVVSGALQNLNVSTGSSPLSPSSANNLDKSHLIVELADVKSRLRKLQQEVEEKNEAITELKDELEHSKETLNKLRQENLELIQDARTAKTYRDEIDILKERVRKVDRLESEIQRYKDKMNELEFYKSRVEELREDNRILVETKTMLEEQLEGSRKRADQVVELESEILKYCTQINELTIEREADREKIQQLLEENTQLHIDRKASMEELSQLQSELSHTFIRCSPLENHSLMEQLNTDAQTRVLQLELENQRLRMLVESLNRSPSFEMRDVDGGHALEKYMEDSDFANCIDAGGENDFASILRENKILKEHNSDLEENIEELKSNTLKLATLESQYQELEKMSQQMKQDLQVQKVELAKYEQLEHTASSLTTENQKLQRMVDTSQRRLGELQQDLQSIENENQKLNNNVESLKLSVRKYHDLERETTQLETVNHRLEQEMKGFEKENNRLRNAVETKDNTIEEYSSRITYLDRENKQLLKEVENLKQIASKVRELERENKELYQLTAVDKKSLEALRHDLVLEKIANQKLNSEINKVKVLKDTSESAKEVIFHDHENQLNELKAADRFLTETAPKNNQEICSFQQLRLEDNKFDISCIEQETLENSIDDFKDLSEKEDKNYVSLRLESLGKEESCLTALRQEIHELKADVLELEKKNSALEEENLNLSNQTSSARDQNANLKSQLEAVEQHLSSVISQSTELQSQLAKLEVEVTLATSQNTTLASQNSAFQTQVSNLEEQNKKVHQQYMELDSKNRCLLNDHESLQKLHEQLTTDYECLVANYSSLKSVHKSLKVEHNNLKDKLQAALFSQEEVMRLKAVLEEDNSRADGRLLINLRSEHTLLKEQLKSLKDSHDVVTTDFKSLQATHKTLKAENNELKLKHTEMQGELSECRNEMSALDIEVSKLSSCCELLSQKNSLLEEEQHALMSHVSILLTQYHELLYEVISEHGQFRKEENSFREKLRELRQQKEKLEQKIFDHSHKLQKSPKRKHLQTSGILRMRRTRSAFLRNVKHTDTLSSHSDNSTDSSLYCSLRRSINKPSGWSQLTRGSVASAEDSSQDDHIPVRDVGLSGQQDISNEPNSSVIAGHTSDKSTLDASQWQGSQHTTVENNMTLNLITNLLTNPEKQGVEKSSVPPHPFSRSHSSQQISPYHHCIPRTTDCFHSLPLTQGPNNTTLGQGKISHPTSALYPETAANHDNLDTSDASKFSRTKQGDKANDQTATYTNMSKDKCPENSVWYEYGCV